MGGNLSWPLGSSVRNCTQERSPIEPPIEKKSTRPHRWQSARFGIYESHHASYCNITVQYKSMLLVMLLVKEAAGVVPLGEGKTRQTSSVGGAALPAQRVCFCQQV